MREQMDSLFESFTPEVVGRPLLAGPDVPATNYRQALSDVYEEDDEVVAKLELPGVDKKDIKVNATEDGIDVQVERKDELEKKEKGVTRYERSYSGFYRHLSLPGADTSKAEASYKDGVLELRMPKSEKSGKLIDVK